MSDQDPFGEVVFSYSRAQAIEDGVLVDVTEAAKEVGFKFHTVVTERVWSLIETNEAVLSKHGQDVRGRLHDVLFMGVTAIRTQKANGDRVYYSVLLPQDVNGSPLDKRHEQKLYVHIGPGDTPAPVLTIMVVGED